MFQPLGTPLFLSASERKGKTYTTIKTFLLFLLLFFIGNALQSVVLTPMLYVLMLTDPAYYDVINGEYESTAQMMESITKYAEGLYEHPAVIAVMLFATAGTTIACLVFCRFIEKRSFASMGMTKKGAFPAYLRGLLLGLVLFSVAVAFSLFFGAVRFTGLNPDFSPALSLLLFLGYLVQGFSEELLCRGMLMVSTARRAPLWYGWLISSFTFAILHTANNGFSLLPFLNLLLFGLLMGLYMIRGGSIWGAAALHSVWNFAEGVLTSFPVSGTRMPTHLLSFVTVEGKELFHGGLFGPEGGLGATFVLAVALTLFAMAETKKAPPATIPTENAD
ncbi:MAG: CPBP family intramembrane metalloprotease [Clostridia bacterium]|nr:CPBP family intramembrane metalloprotease [Clostridia bacterium]